MTENLNEGVKSEREGTGISENPISFPQAMERTELWFLN
jgi:hypothetical protein